MVTQSGMENASGSHPSEQRRSEPHCLSEIVYRRTDHLSLSGILESRPENSESPNS